MNRVEGINLIEISNICKELNISTDTLEYNLKLNKNKSVYSVLLETINKYGIVYEGKLYKKFSDLCKSFQKEERSILNEIGKGKELDSILKENTKKKEKQKIGIKECIKDLGLTSEFVNDIGNILKTEYNIKYKTVGEAVDLIYLFTKTCINKSKNKNIFKGLYKVPYLIIENKVYNSKLDFELEYNVKLKGSIEDMLDSYEIQYYFDGKWRKEEEIRDLNKVFDTRVVLTNLYKLYQLDGKNIVYVKNELEKIVKGEL